MASTSQQTTQLSMEQRAEQEDIEDNMYVRGMLHPT